WEAAVPDDPALPGLSSARRLLRGQASRRRSRADGVVTRSRLRAAAWICVLAFATIAASLAGCGAASDVRDRISGNSTPHPTRTPEPTSTPTVPPPPTATPTPSLPANPLDLNRWNSVAVHYCIDTSEA